MPRSSNSDDDHRPPAPSGFEHHELTVFFNNKFSWVELLLPQRPGIDELVRYRTFLAQEAALLFESQERAKRQAELKQNDQPGDAELKFAPSKKAEELSMPEERDRLQKRYEQDVSTLGSNEWAQVYPWDEPLKLLAQLAATPDKDLRGRDKDLYKTLRDKGAFRKLGAGGDGLDALAQELRRLGREQPHFGEAIAMILSQVQLAKVKGAHLRIPPMLLVGAPGVGKTHFTFELVKAVLRPILRYNLDSERTSSSLTGSARYWANTHTGVVFDLVCRGDRADPLVLLDELDKARPAARGNSPLGPLHGLLEPLTATKVTDISADMEFDASHIFWVATANDLAWIPGPIKSRFRIFHIPMPTAEQAIALAQAVGLSVHQRMNASPGDADPAGGQVFEAPSPRLFNLLAHLTPRQQIQALEQAYATALTHGRRQVTRQDLPMDVLIEDGEHRDSNERLH